MTVDVMNSPDQVDGQVRRKAFAASLNRQRVGNTAYVVLGGGSFMLLIITYLVLPSIGSSPFFRFLPLFFVLPLAVLVGRFLIIRSRLNRIEAAMPTHDTSLCARCIEPMQLGHDLDIVSCATCGARFTTEDLRAYWDMFINEPKMAARWHPKLLKRAGGRGANLFQTTIARIREDYRWRLTYIAIIMTVFGLAYCAATGTSIFSGMQVVGPAMLVVGSIFCFEAGWKRREGAGRFCTSCGYQQTPKRHVAIPELCPECNADWHAEGGTIAGQVKFKPWLLVIGSVLLVGVFWLSFQPAWLTGGMAKLMPTSTLIREVTSPNAGFTNEQWAELNKRTLNDDQRIALARGLLDKRMERTYIDATDDGWLNTQIAANVLPTEIVDRYFREGIDIWLIGPAQANIGQTIEITIGTRYRAGGGPGPTPTALISGFFVNEETEPRHRQDAAIDGILLGHERHSISGTREETGGGPALELTAEYPGPLRIRLELWIAHAPCGSVGQITWNEDGTPVTPAAAVRMEQRTAEHTINVVE